MANHIARYQEFKYKTDAWDPVVINYGALANVERLIEFVALKKKKK